MSPTALIVTLQMDAAAAARFTALRTAHFPAHRNWLDAHITLFHALPVASLAEVLAVAGDVARTTTRFALQVDRVRFLGAGVAYEIESAQASALRKTLAARWEPLLGRQDRSSTGRLHITVQNKVAPALAKALHAQLSDHFVPEVIQATGLEVWNYLGGPWRPAAAFAFAD